MRLVAMELRKCLTLKIQSTCAGVVCPNLPNPENGQVAQIINGNVPGTVANYSCDSGYTLVGNMSRVCVQVNREEEVWTGEAPTCQRKENYIDICNWSLMDFCI